MTWRDRALRAEAAIENEAIVTRGLRAALKEIAELGEQGMKPNYNEWLTFHNKVAQVARAALA